MSIVSLRKFLEMDSGEARLEASRAEPPPVPRSGQDAPECLPACEAWMEHFEVLFPALPEEGGSASVRTLTAPPGAWQTAGERRRVLAASLELAEVRRAAERESLRRQADEVRGLVATFNEAVLTLASGGEEVAGRFRRVEASLTRAARMDNLASVRGCLSETMELMRRESRAHEEATAARVAAFEAELARARGALLQPVEREGLDRGEACRMIRRALDGRAASEFVATVVVFDRLAAAGARFGPALASEALSAFARVRASDSAEGGAVYRWSERCLLWQARTGLEPAALRAAMEGLLGRPFDYRTVSGGRPAVLSMQGRWLCAVPGEGGAEVLIEEIDRFAGGGTAQR